MGRSHDRSFHRRHRMARKKAPPALELPVRRLVKLRRGHGKLVYLSDAPSAARGTPWPQRSTSETLIDTTSSSPALGARLRGDDRRERPPVDSPAGARGGEVRPLRLHAGGPLTLTIDGYVLLLGR